MASRSRSTPTPTEADAPVLNENHRRHLLASCVYVDRLLADIDTVVATADSASPFARYVNDLSPALARVVRDYLTRLRTDMLRVLERHHAMPESPRISAVHAIRTALSFVDIALVELKPEYIRGYGEVPPSLVPEINGFVEELQSVVRALDRALAAGQAGDIDERLKRLERAGEDVSILASLERTIDEQGLVEFRPALDTALARLEDQRFEVAGFGRVSAGKSSLLNHLMGQAVLPVGVTPITAVPTRVTYGATASVDVEFADRRAERVDLDRLGDFVTEQQNPANAKHVTRLVVHVPAPRLQEGIVFVDTPGLGSLATSGAAETLAYLPRCDLAVVLIDAASTLTEASIAPMHRLQQAAIPAMVVLSKADLVSADDRDRAVAYTSRQLSTELGTPVAVRAISTAAGSEGLLDAWIEDDLRPLLARHRELAHASVLRKIGALRAGVDAALEARTRVRLARGSTPAVAPAIVERDLRATSGGFDDARRAIDEGGDVRREEPDAALHEIAAALVEAGLNGATPADTTVQDTLTHIGAAKAERIARLLQTLAADAQRVLATTASALGLPEPSTDDEWQSLLRGLPQIDVGTLTVDLRLPMIGALGHDVARVRVYRALRAQIAEGVAAAIDGHAKLLRSWGLGALARLRQQFDVQAQIYRARLADAVGAGSASRTIDDSAPH